MPQKISEKMKVHEQWYVEAREMTVNQLPEFIERLTTQYEHDYGTICHAIAAGSVATAWAINKSPDGGITGFQGGAVMWEFIRHWNSFKGPLRLVQYEHMLFPQYEDGFDKVVDGKTFKWLQEQAGERLAENMQVKAENGDNHGAVESVVEHWQSIVDGTVPFGYRIKED